MSEKIWQRLLLDNEPEVIHVAMGNKESGEYIDETIQNKLSTHPYMPIRKSLAKMPNLKERSWEILAKDPDREVRLTLARNPNITGMALQILAMDTDEEVAIEVCNRNIIPQEVAMTLAQCGSIPTLDALKDWCREGLKEGSISKNYYSDVMYILGERLKPTKDMAANDLALEGP